MEQLCPSSQDLHDQYDKTLDLVIGKDRHELLRLLQWVCFSTRPLSLAELRYATALDPKHPIKSIAEIKASPTFVHTDEDMEEKILDLSRGLLEVKRTPKRRRWMTATSTVMQSSPKPLESNLVRPTHESVKEYLVNHGIRKLCENGHLTNDP